MENNTPNPETRRESLDALELKLCGLINEDALLQSLLYDLDLLPEQLERKTPNWARMMIICEHWQAGRARAQDNFQTKDDALKLKESVAHPQRSEGE